MRKIQANDKIELNNSIDKVWNVLIDIPNYYKWWTRIVSIDVSNFSDKIVGTEFTVKPFNGQSFSCRIESIILKEEIILNYFDGLYRGEGKWKLIGNKNSTTVSYQVNLIIVNKLIIVLSYFLPISKNTLICISKDIFGIAKISI